ncbi:MAG: hypothetical protein A2186_03960 [Candidatus Levybacteria bacterium RIFOXYA1_FULL_41_10]|nr:MAG: putative glycosyltransferase [Candidatus Levybacteria bacterium GW2011_GWB1_36_18]KKR17967.1 MAG: putative glycosyltransferase [Candidatus Levybacteria bacterium GW2011_GWA1_39_32]KKR51601.1 MAG: putative glycosyltransferase [Candidatus Levybacteria bacterium GW2011_GWC1_40_19]KKR73109.1 MAG: putative glycosyltransferase [Candidatus Levybacteria bacterium GW2011_GWC2_40_7]KKR95220.1 MAG: putative glycosyltransferase [Candidatus Levybacteria bacterium GW2011_GWA2_41_15]OGH20861.1 MAG: h
MNVAFFHELHFGGARRVVVEYGKVFSKYHKIDLYYVDRQNEKDLEKIFKEHSFYPFLYKQYDGGNFPLKIYKDLVEPIRLYFLHKKIARDIDKMKYDFVFVHPSQFTHAPFILRFLKTPTVYFCHEPLRIAHDPTLIFSRKGSLKNIYEGFVRIVKREIDSSNIKHAKLVLANSNYTKSNIRRAYGKNSTKCYLGVDSDVFKPINVRKKYDVIFVGKDVWIEGYDTFLKIIKLFKNKLKVYVVKPEKGNFITDKELVRKYSSAKVVAVLGRFDPFSMVPWEGMATGAVPVVVKEGGPIEAVRDGVTGYLVERDAKKMKSAIEKLLKDRELRGRIAKKGREEVLSTWNWERSSERVLDIVKKKLLK